jgi:hypothetical protein
MFPYVEAGATVQIMLNLGVLADPSTVVRSSRLFSEVVEEARGGVPACHRGHGRPRIHAVKVSAQSGCDDDE